MKILIVIDMQNDFVTGSLGTPEAVSVVNKIEQKIKNTSFPTPIIFTRDTHQDNYLNTLEGEKLPIEHCIEATPGWCIVDTLRKAIKDVDVSLPIIINKNSFGYTDWKDLFSTLYKNSWAEGINEIEIVGVCTDICVISNALILKALFPGIRISVDASCCAGTTPEMHKKALDVMKSCQIDIINENI